MVERKRQVALFRSVATCGGRRQTVGNVNARPTVNSVLRQILARFVAGFLVGSSLLGFGALDAGAADAESVLSREAVTARVREGIGLLNKTYWSPTLNIWLDRPGDDLRAHYERRLNPPWWPSANAVEMLIDFMNATGSSEYDGRIEALYDLLKDRRTRMARVVAELKRRGHEVKEVKVNGGGYQGILIDWEKGELHGASESRRDGEAKGY